MAGFQKKSLLERRCNKSVGFLCPFWGCWGGLRSGKRIHFGAQVWISMPFLGLSGGFPARKKNMHFGARVWISIPFLGFFGEGGKRASSLRFQNGDEENCCLIWVPRGGLGLSSANGGVFLVSEGLRPMLGPCWATKIPSAKRKVLAFMFGHFEALVLSSNRKGFLLEVDFGASKAMFRPILGHFGAPRRPVGLQFELRHKESPHLGLNQRSKRGVSGHYLALCWNIDSILGWCWADKCHIKARTHNVHIDVCHNSFAA